MKKKPSPKKKASKKKAAKKSGINPYGKNHRKRGKARDPEENDYFLRRDDDVGEED